MPRKGPMPAPKLPVEPLLEFHDGMNILSIARALHCTNSDIYRWKREGITIWRADQIAVDKLGVHPAVVWGEMWWEAADREAA
jgi:hypothetical protein